MQTSTGRRCTLGAVVVFAALFLAGLVGLVGACASDSGKNKTSPAGAWATAKALGASDARLASLLGVRPAGEGWEAEGEWFTSPGWRGAAEKRWSDLGARLPARADGVRDIGIATFPALRLRLTPHDAMDLKSVKGELHDGHLVYAGAYANVDIVLSTTRDSVEELLVLHEPTTRVFAWDVELPSGIARAFMRADGSLRFEDTLGRHVMHVPAPYAVDARGIKRPAKLTWNDGPGKHVLGVELDLDAARGLTYPVLLNPAFETAVWEQVQAPTAPNVGEISGQAMAYDPARGRVVLFGGYDGGVVSNNDTWEWDGTTWTKLAPASSPPGRDHHAMVYDAARRVIVLFGGRDQFHGLELNDTWTWDGTTWTKASPAVSPPPNDSQGIAFDAARGNVVLFGGAQIGTDTWTWNGVTWTQVFPTRSPPSRQAHALAYDAVRGNVVLFGGFSAGAGANDTWIWDGSDWTNVSPAGSPPARSGQSLVFDPLRGVVFLFGGAGTSTLNDAWTWNGTSWANVTPASSPAVRFEHGAAFDAAHGRVVIVGGANGMNELDDTWTWDGAAWTQVSAFAPPPTRQFLSMANDATRARVVLFGGYGASSTYLNDTWTWDGAKWTNATPATPATSPSGRNGHAMAFDAARAQVVLFGGGANPAPDKNDTWTWNGSAWTQLFPATSPPAREFHAMAYDAARAQVVLFSGFLAGTPNDTWTWNGTTWTHLSPATSPPPRHTHAMAYDAARQVVVLFGGHRTDTGVELNDTWTWNGTTWTQLFPAASPPVRDYHAMAYDAARGRVVLFGGAGSQNGYYGDTWTWDGTTWAQVTPAVSPSARGNHGLAYDAARSRVVLFGNSNSFPPADTWLYSTRAGSCAATTECASGFCVDGVCCDAPSCGTCQACNGASAPGSCTSVTNAPDPDSCTGAQACDATGACRPGLGSTCTIGSDCASGFCAENVCCDSACAGTCQACSAALKTSGPSGTCGDAKSGVDPHDDCGDDGVVSCKRDGECDGTGRCRLYPPGTACGATVSCAQNRASSQRCDGLGNCANAVTAVDCAPYLCNPATGGCPTSCANDDECVLGNYCAMSGPSGTCTPRLGFGKACTTAAGCPLGAFCADGVCCNTPCTGQCEVCDRADALGSCIPQQGAPHTGRTACAAATASNVCSAASCDGTERATCNGFVGPQTACRVASCTDGIATLPAKCSGKGLCQDLVTVPCTPYACAGDRCGTSCASDAECDIRFQCGANHTCVPRTGASCDGDHTLGAPDGTKTDCAPYRCAGAACKTMCASVADCADANVCVAGVCLPAADATTNQEGGCQIAPGTDARFGAGSLLLLSGAMLMRRRRRDRGMAA